MGIVTETTNICSCDICKVQTEIHGTNCIEQLNNEGWLHIREKKWENYGVPALLCPKCKEFYKKLDIKIGDQVESLINDGKSLEKGEMYTVSDVIYEHDYALPWQKENRGIYVSVGGHWQASLYLGQYKLIDDKVFY